jgi:site-specific DNA-methyltransferase (adenine-specific)
MPDPYFEAQGVRVFHGDCLDVLPELDTEFTATVTDPPYGISFMSENWDHGVPGEPFWEAVRDSMAPGAPLLAFGGTRTFHRLWVAIEDAGFELRDSISWMYGNGFPKSHDVSSAIDQKEYDRREEKVLDALSEKGYEGITWHSDRAED